MKVFYSAALAPNYTNKVFRFRSCLLSAVKLIFSLLSGGESCVCCGKKSLAVLLCAKCQGVFLKSCLNQDAPRCGICGKPLVSERELCSDCRKSPVLKSCDGVYPLSSYRLWRKTLLFSWKMLGKRSLSPFFALAVHEKLSELEAALGVSLPIVPVPPRPGKIREKGWDQIQDLCFYLSNGWNVKILPLLKRNSRRQQKKLDRTQRLGNIGSSYSLSSKAMARRIEIPGKAVILDDVLTTGATVENCAALLKSAGVSEVYVITLFIVD